MAGWNLENANTGRHDKDRIIILSHCRGHRHHRSSSSSISISIETLSQETIVIYVFDIVYAEYDV